MRRSIVHEGASNLKYEIREIVGVAREISSLGQTVTGENIGDPIEKGEEVAPWIRDIVRGLLDQSMSFGY